MTNGRAGGVEQGSAMEVDPPLSSSPPSLLPGTPHSPHTLHPADVGEVEKRPLSMGFDRDQDYLRKVLAFGKDLQNLFGTLEGCTPDSKLKHLMQVRCCCGVLPSSPSSLSGTTNSTNLIICREVGVCLSVL